MLSVCLCAGLADNEDKSDVQAIIESTPELDMDLAPNTIHNARAVGNYKCRKECGLLQI